MEWFFFGTVSHFMLRFGVRAAIVHTYTCIFVYWNWIGFFFWFGWVCVSYIEKPVTGWNSTKSIRIHSTRHWAQRRLQWNIVDVYFFFFVNSTRHRPFRQFPVKLFSFHFILFHVFYLMLCVVWLHGYIPHAILESINFVKGGWFGMKTQKSHKSIGNLVNQSNWLIEHKKLEFFNSIHVHSTLIKQEKKRKNENGKRKTTDRSKWDR